jgi:N-[(2S)-2-amino-2-carboxyethyl]-L-glutamate dehydrogenase
MLLLDRAQITDIINRYPDIVRSAVGGVYASLTDGLTVNPKSVFLRWPDDPASRVISLPARVSNQGGQSFLGIKWVSSFPRNLEIGEPRANALILLSDDTTGKPLALLDGGLISLLRTAASAVLASRCIGYESFRGSVGVFGAGPLAGCVLEEMFATGWTPSLISVFDLDRDRGGIFVDRLRKRGYDCVFAPAESVLKSSTVVLFATTATSPWLQSVDTSGGAASLFLHLSLRDLSPSVLLRATNITDSLSHALNEGTSLGQAVLLGLQPGDIIEMPQLVAEGNLPTDGLVVFSPFGLGALDVAVAGAVFEAAQSMGIGSSWEPL